MNEERVPINLYTLDIDGGHEMTEEELKKEKRHETAPWIFLICMCILFGAVLIYIGTRKIDDVFGFLVGFSILIIVLIVISVYNIIKLNKRYNAHKDNKYVG